MPSLLKLLGNLLDAFLQHPITTLPRWNDRDGRKILRGVHLRWYREAECVGQIVHESRWIVRRRRMFVWDQDRHCCIAHRRLVGSIRVAVLSWWWSVHAIEVIRAKPLVGVLRLVVMCECRVIQCATVAGVELGGDCSRMVPARMYRRVTLIWLKRVAICLKLQRRQKAVRRTRHTDRRIISCLERLSQ